MKNLFLTLAFVLVTAFSFANTNLSNSAQEKSEKVEQAGVNGIDFILWG